MNEDKNFIKEEIIYFYTKKRIEVTGQQVHYNFPKYAETFEKAAEICMELNAEPEVFVRSQFAYSDDGNVYPYFLSKNKDKVIEQYNKFMARTSMSLDAWYDLQLKYLADQVKYALRPVERALADEHLNFKPWFRICITKEPNPDIIAVFGKEAKEQYEADKELQKFMAKKKLDHTRFTK